MGKKYQRFGSDQKVIVLKRHLLDKVAVSDLCDEFGIQPTVFYRWQKQFFENGAAAFENQTPKKNNREEERIKALQDKMRKKDEVLAELMEEHVALKKSLGAI